MSKRYKTSKHWALQPRRIAHLDLVQWVPAADDRRPLGPGETLALSSADAATRFRASRARAETLRLRDEENEFVYPPGALQVQDPEALEQLDRETRDAELAAALAQQSQVPERRTRQPRRADGDEEEEEEEVELDLEEDDEEIVYAETDSE